MLANVHIIARREHAEPVGDEPAKRADMCLGMCVDMHTYMCTDTSARTQEAFDEFSEREDISLGRAVVDDCHDYIGLYSYGPYSYGREDISLERAVVDDGHASKCVWTCA